MKWEETNMRRLIIFLIRKRLGLRKSEPFRFENQKSRTDWYMFTDIDILKHTTDERGNEVIRQSTVSLNWLLDEKCKIVKMQVS